MDGSPFSGRVLVALAGVAVAVFALSFFLAAHGGGERNADKVVGPSTYSHSAIGHAGFYELLKKLGLPAVRGQGDALAKTGVEGVYVIAEPDLGYLSGAGALGPATARTMLLVLPKRWGVRAKDRPDWIGRSDLEPRDLPLTAVRAVDGKAQVMRAKPPGQWTVNALDATPAFPGDVQLIRSPGMRPIVASTEGILVGEVADDDRRVWVLSDPDVIENHGLALKGNPSFAVAMIEALRRDRAGSIVFDEAAHGITRAPESPLKLLLTFPYSLITLQTVLAVALLLAAAMTRFGRPQAAPPPLDLGKESLIANSAALLDYAGHQASILQRYARVTLHDTARQLHAPKMLDDAGLAAWLDRIGAARGVEIRCTDILNRIGAQDGGPAPTLTTLFTAARDLHRWKGIILDGSSAHPRRH